MCVCVSVCVCLMLKLKRQSDRFFCSLSLFPVCLSESEASVLEAGRPADPGETETGRGPRKTSGRDKVPAELRHEDVVAEELRRSTPETSCRETSPSHSEAARRPHPREERQVCPPGSMCRMSTLKYKYRSISTS